jgi:amino acid adenylation domain-containing protein
MSLSANFSFLDSKLEKEKDYWLEKLAGELVVSGIPLDFSRPSAFIEQKAVVSTGIDSETESKLLKVCGNNETLVFMFLVAALKICLHKYTGLEDIIVGTAIHERFGELAQLNKVLALRDRVSSEVTVRQLLLDIKSTLSQAYAYQKYPFERILDRLSIEPQQNRAPLFDVVVLLDKINRRENTEHLKTDVTLLFSMGGDGLNAVIEYNSTLFKKETIELFSRDYQNILRAALDSPDAQISRLGLLTEDKKREFIFEFNRTERDYPRHRPIHHLFEEQADETPTNVAVSFEESQLTYDQLNRRANQLAHHLRRLGAGPGTLVGLCVEHSLEAVVGLLGILKAGAAYVPLEPEHPRSKLAFMLEDAQTSILLTQAQLLGSLPETEQRKVICLDADWEIVAGESESNPESGATADDLAYVIYTSGSTGRPKGVKIQHRALVNYIWWAIEVYLRGESLDFPLYSSLAFDLTVTSLFTPLLTGNRVIVYRKELRESPVPDILRDNQTGVLKLTPSHLALIKDKDYSQSKVRRLIVGGEAFERELARQIHESFGGRVEIINEYGPTEATVGCMFYRFDPERDDRAFVPVGRPAANAQIYVLDENLKPVAENVLGELYISGDGLAEGYLNQDDLTKERFVDNPFIAGRKMYRSGDLARRLADGNLEYAGRADEQVKFHGYRVELNEVRSALNRHPQVRDSVVRLTRDQNGNDVLVAYYVARQELEAAALRAFLSETLIVETIPNVFIYLRKLPLTLNGKVNLRALPTLEEWRQQITHGFVAPRTPVEEALAGIWSEVLGIKRLGVHDNFFELGGHSLLATQILSRVRAAFDVELHLRALFESPTVADLGKQIEAAVAADKGLQEKSAIKPVSRASQPPLSFAQQRLWLLNQLEPDSPAYNIPVAVRLNGELKVAALERTLGEIIKRHEVLRTTFTVKDGQPVQVIHPATTFRLPLIDLSALPEAEREREASALAAREAGRSFDLAQGPLLRATLLKLGEQEHVALFTMHHIISDGWAMNVLIKEVMTLYEAFSLNQPSPLADLAIQYADYAAWQHDYLRGEGLETHLRYWRKQLAGAPALLALPTDHPRPQAQTFRGTTRSFVLPAQMTEEVKRLSRIEGATLFMTLLAAFQTLLHRYTGQDDIVVGSDIANRSRLETEGLLGCFFNLLALRTDFSDNPTFRQLLGRVRETTLGAYTHQDLPFEKLVEELQPARDPSYSPLFQVIFDFQSQTRQPVLQLPGLTLSPLPLPSTVSKFDLSLFIVEQAEELSCTLEYNTDLFDAATIERLIASFQTLLEEIVRNPDARIQRIAMTSAEESEQLVHAFNDDLG